jgi:hypothetical protein
LEVKKSKIYQVTEGRESTVDYDSDNRLKEWAEKLDCMKGELSAQKIVDELYDWTARRMADAAENDSKADEMLLKRCAYHGLNFAAPFIVMRHWDKMHQEGQYWCGEFETDDVDWRLEVKLSQDGNPDAVVYQCTIVPFDIL